MSNFIQRIESELDDIRAAGLWKQEFSITSPQNARFTLGADGETAGDKSNGEYINFCANNYLGLSDHPVICQAAGASLESRGFGMSSVRFICGTQDTHKALEQRLSTFLGTDDAILYSSCFDANGGLFETLLGAEDAVVSDALNHASIIDGIRLSKARRFRYENRNMDDLRKQLMQAREDGARNILIATDGVFSMDGTYAPLDDICAIADEFDASVMVDDSHAVGFVGDSGAGTVEKFGVTERVDIITGTLGKALGGASGGYTAGRKAFIELLRQRSRPYLFSNSLAPPITAAAIAALDLNAASGDLRKRLWENTEYFRGKLMELGFELPEDAHPIIPLMYFDEARASAAASHLFARGIYAVAFSFPVVPRGMARVRLQVSAAHTMEDLDRTLAAIASVPNAG